MYKENNFTIPIIDKRPTSLTYKKCRQINKKKANNPIENWAENTATLRNTDGQSATLLITMKLNQRKINYLPLREVGFLKFDNTQS